METNVALKILLEKRDEDKKKLEEKVMFNVEKLIRPYLEKLQLRCNEDSQESLLKIIQSNLDEVTSSFAHNILLTTPYFLLVFRCLLIRCAKPVFCSLKSRFFLLFQHYFARKSLYYKSDFHTILKPVV